MGTSGSNVVRRVVSAYTAEWTRSLGLDILAGLVSGAFLEVLKRGVLASGGGGIGITAIVFGALFTGLLTTLHVLRMTHVDGRLDEHHDQLDTRFSRLERLVRLVALREAPSLTDGAGARTTESDRRGDVGRLGGALVGAGVGVLGGPIGSAVGGIAGAIGGTLLQLGVAERTRAREVDRWTADTAVTEELLAARESLEETLREDLEADVRETLREDLEAEVRAQLREELREEVREDLRETGAQPNGPDTAAKPGASEATVGEGGAAAASDAGDADDLPGTSDELSPLWVAVLGGHGHGKSTLLGRLLVELGEVSEERLAEVRATAEDRGMAEQAYAFLVDSLAAERDERGSIDTSEVVLSTDQFRLTLVDTPGDPRYVTNTAAAMETTDAAILVVAADEGIDPTVREHAFLARTLGHREYLVVVSKLDAVDYDEAAFESVRGNARELFTSLGVEEDTVRVVPCAALEGVNVTSADSRLEWYDGPTVWDAIDAFAPPERALDGPLRIPIEDVYSIAGIGTVATGRIAQGVLETGMDVTFRPTGGEGEVESIEIENESVDRAGPGSMVGLTVRGVGPDDVTPGDVCGPVANPPSVPTTFTAEVQVVEGGDVLTAGATLQLDVHSTTIPVTITAINHQIDLETNEVVAEAPYVLAPGTAGEVTVRPEQPVPIDIQRTAPDLGSFALTAEGRLIAAGRVTALDPS